MPEQDEFEIGTEPIEVQRKPRAGVVLSVRLSPEEADRIEDIADDRGMTVSQVARQAISSYLGTRSGRQIAVSPTTSVSIGGGDVSFTWTNPGGVKFETRGDVRVPEGVPQT